MLKTLLIASLLAGALGAVTAPATAAVIIVREAPPAPRSERIPPPRRGYVWAPGHWVWQNNHHVWVRGKYLRARKGYAYRAPSWEQRDGRWHMMGGNWERTRRDRDGDGVRNRDDARPDNPNRN